MFRNYEAIMNIKRIFKQIIRIKMEKIRRNKNIT